MSIPITPEAIDRERQSRQAFSAAIRDSKSSWGLINSDTDLALNRLPRGIADLVFTDPPYNIGVKYEGDPTADAMTSTGFRFYLRKWCTGIAHAARPGAAVFILISEEWADTLGQIMTEIIGPRENRIIWHERFAQYNARGLTKEHRHLFLHRNDPMPFTTEEMRPRVHTFNPDPIRERSARQEMGDKRADPRGRVPGNVWRVRRLQGTSKDRVGWHPAQLPPEPLERIVKGWSNPGDLILDPFAGAGSTMLAALKHGRRALGIERSAHYCEKIYGRLRNAGHDH